MDFVAVRAALMRRRIPIYLHARLIDMSEGRLLRILSGRTTASPEELQRILAPLDLKVADISTPSPSESRQAA